MASLVQPLPCQSAFASAPYQQYPIPPWDGTIDLETPSLDTAAAGSFLWPPALANAAPPITTPTLSPQMFAHGQAQELAEVTPLSRSTVSSGLIRSGLPRGSESAGDFAIPPTGSEAYAPRKRTRTSAQLPLSSINEDAAATTRSKRSHTKSVSTTPSQQEDAQNESDEHQNEDEDQEKLRIYRERNRIAAAKTRRKKKSSAKQLEERAQDALVRNEQLKQEERTLRDALSSLRFSALAHDPATGCNCSDIQLYNRKRAMEMAQGLSKGTSMP